MPDEDGLPPHKYRAPCEVCGQEMVLENYDGGTCPHCGIEYDYDEGNHIDLDREMLEMILELLNRRKESDHA